MTDCTSKVMQFSPLNSKRVEASFSGGAITSDAGLLLLREVDKQSRLTKRLSKVIRDKRHAGYIEHSVEHLLKQRIYAIAAGYEDVNDHDFLCNDECFQTAVGRDVKLASASTLSRFENALDRHSLVAISKVLVEHFIESFKKPPKELLLDFDPTDNVIYGEQTQRHYHGYYRNYCFLPLHVFCGDQLLVSLLRPSNIDGARYAGAILRLLVKRFREVWPEVKILFRGDCAFGRKRILHWCEHNNVDYIVGLAGNARLQAITKSTVEYAEKQYEVTQTKQRLFTGFNYGAETWKTKRRVIAKIEHHEHGSNLRYVVTNMKHSPENLYDEQYCPRGDMENGIKQLKLDLSSDRNSCHDFLANQFRLLLSSIAYILLTDLRRLHLSKTKLAKAYCGSIRLKLIKIGAVILKNSRRIQFLLSSHYPEQLDFIKAVESVAPT
jgi:hypothetical protein